MGVPKRKDEFSVAPARQAADSAARMTGRAFSRAQFGRWASFIAWLMLPAYCLLLIRQHRRLLILDKYGLVQITPCGRQLHPAKGAGLLMGCGPSAASLRHLG